MPGAAPECPCRLWEERRFAPDDSAYGAREDSYPIGMTGLMAREKIFIRVRCVPRGESLRLNESRCELHAVPVDHRLIELDAKARSFDGQASRRIGGGERMKRRIRPVEHLDGQAARQRGEQVNRIMRKRWPPTVAPNALKIGRAHV